MKVQLNPNTSFEARHNGHDQDLTEMLQVVRAESIDQLIDETIPDGIRKSSRMNLPEALSEHKFLSEFKKLASKNELFKNYIGMGYYHNHLPAVIQRNILENPGWYTAYTPYQAEIAQGRLEALINFQTMISDLTGMDLANASLLDEGTAVAEAMAMLAAQRKGAKRKNANKFLVDKNVFPQTLDILKTRAIPNGVELIVEDVYKADLTDPELYGLFVQYPNSTGSVQDHSDLFKTAKENDIFVAVSADLLALVLLKSPGEMGADVVVGSSQRFGVPLGYGGPHAAFFATREEFKRQLPGRIIGASQDAKGNPGFRMALQTREQHIRREKATSNICTAQVLLAVIAGMYAVYHGPKGLRRIAERTHGLTAVLKKELEANQVSVENSTFFDTLTVRVSDAHSVRERAESRKINMAYPGDNQVRISLDETTTSDDINELVKVVSGNAVQEIPSEIDSPVSQLFRTDTILDHPVFQKYQTEHEILRYMKRLENKDLSLVHSMISLGSCTMKLNATSEMIPITWPEFSDIHPFAPKEQAKGYDELFRNLNDWLCEITGFDAISLQPNSGAQGEFAGLMVIKGYHESRGDGHRNITLIPSSAHGTNPASAVMAGMKVVIVACDERGNIDLDDLRKKAEENRENLSSLMVTYPSTHGVFETSIKEVCEIIHENGGQVYMDGANMNAQVGLTSPAIIGADVCHLNLHKTFCIPHGGGGPGMGPIGVVEHLKPFLPGNPVVESGGDQAITAISAAPWGSAGILPISYAYIAMMGEEGLTNATKRAILNANYIKSRLEEHFKILYTGEKGRCAHEMIVDCREFKKDGVEVEDIAKRLMDYGYHAPTVSFPVAGTLMVEPTESETREELDRFCNALISIRKEIEEIRNGDQDRENNVLKNAPHTAEVVSANDWDYPYSREKAAYPLPELKERKFWTSVSRVDNAYGDRNLFCSCLPIEEISG